MVSRGEIWEWASPAHGLAIVLVVSSDDRNHVFPRTLVCPVSTQIELPALPRTVRLQDAEPVRGRVLCDFIYDVNSGELVRNLGPLSRQAMAAVDAELIAVLDLPT